MTIRTCVIEISYTTLDPESVKGAIEDALSSLFENDFSEIDGTNAEASVGHYLKDLDG